MEWFKYSRLDVMQRFVDSTPTGSTARGRLNIADELDYEPRPAMRELDDEERLLLRHLDAGVSTGDLVVIVRDLGEILRSRGHVIQANVAEIAADRLQLLSARAEA